MKLVLVAIAALALSAQAQAAEINLGTISCIGGVIIGDCGSFPKMENWAANEASKKLKCNPNQGQCSVNMNNTYKLEIEVGEIDGCGITHYTWRGTPFNNPAQGHFLIFSSETITNWSCQHQHCGSGDPSQGW